MDKWEKFSETILTPKSNFFSKVMDSGISDDDYEYAKMIWTEFKVINLGEYSDLYLKTDVLLLADVFETFRDVCLTNYELIHVGIILHQDLVGMQCSSVPTLN